MALDQPVRLRTDDRLILQIYMLVEIAARPEQPHELRAESRDFRMMAAGVARSDR